MQNTYIDNAYLDQLGVLKDDQIRDYMGDQIVALLNIRMANRLSEIMSDAQMNEFMSLSDSRKNWWLEHNIHGYKHIISEELKAIVSDIKAVMP